ncbi:protein required for normal CLN1 and CLN2 G1 cyclin expression [Chytridiales sp. JEL 0842]|nr:protein required for normal CLN1 and CLN2 G1 cyclin expression [Chytridiales sp. JEL 0842]
MNRAHKQKEYHAINMLDAFEKVLLAASNLALSSASFSRDPHCIQVLYTLASYYMELAQNAKKGELRPDRRDFDTLVQLATQLINRADQINSRDPWILISKGNLFLITQRLDEAIKQFRYALEIGKRNPSALFGLASALTQKGDHKAALTMYQQILSISPDLHPSVRVAIGLCYHKLGMIPEARAAFERAEMANPESVDAAALLAIMDWNDARLYGDEDSLRRSTQRVNEAFTKNNNNPLVLNLLAERAFVKRDFKKVDILSKAAIQRSDAPTVLAQSHAIRARSLHAQGIYPEALEHYTKAAELDPQSPEIQYGLGEIYVAIGNRAKAIECFEKVVAKEADDFDTLKKLGALQTANPEMHEKALTCFTKIQALYAGDDKEDKSKKLEEGIIPEPEIQLDYAKLLESTNPKVASKGYANALSMLESANLRVPCELLNNLAVFQHSEAHQRLLTINTADDLVVAKELYDKAMKSASDTNSEALTSIMYNVARVYESLGDVEAATRTYEEVLEKHPAYTDALYRTATLTLGKGTATEARDIIRKGFSVDRKAALLLLGVSLFEDSSDKGNLRESRKTFEEVLQKFDKHNLYALCSIGNIYLVIAKHDPKNRDVHLRRALEFFDKALRLDGKNVYAANGIAITLAENGQLESAREVLTQYERVLKKTPEDNSYILQCLARAHYIIAKTEKDPEAMLKSLSAIEKAVLLEPSKLPLLYNVALVKQQYAQVLNDQPIDKRDLVAMRKALAGLDSSRQIFQSLGEQPNTPGAGYDLKHAKERAAYCKDVARVSEKRIHETDVLEKQRNERLAAIKEEKMKVEAEKAEEERLKREEEQRKREEIERKRREIMAKVQEDNMKARESMEAEERAASSKRSRRTDTDSEEEEEDTGAPKEEKPKKKKRSKKRKERSVSAEVDGDEERVEKQSRKRKIASDDDDDEEEEDLVKRGRANVGRPSTLSKAIIDSDDENF